MRALLSKVLTGSMVAGAALLVAACGGNNNTANNSTTADLGNDTSMMGNDVTSVDASAAGGNMAADTNATMDTNSMSSNSTGDTAGNATNGM